MKKTEIHEMFNALGKLSCDYSLKDNGDLIYTINNDFDVDIYPAYYSGLSSREYVWLDVWYQKRRLCFPRMAVPIGKVPEALEQIIKVLKKANFDIGYIYCNFNILDLPDPVLVSEIEPYQDQLKGY